MADANLPNDLHGLDIENWEFLHTEEMSAMYQHYPVEQWETQHVRCWLHDVSARRSIDSPDLGDLQNCTGIQLSMMTAQEFQQRCPAYGRVFHDEFINYMQSPSYPGNNEYHPERLMEPHANAVMNPSGGTNAFNPGAPSIANQYVGSNTDPFYDESVWSPTPYYSDYYLHPNPFNPYHPVPPQESHPPYVSHYPVENNSSDYFSQESLPHRSGLSALNREYTPQEPYHPSESSPAPSTPHPEATGGPETSRQSAERRRRTRGERGPKLWEFLLNLLNDPAYNPRIILWENQEEHIFKLIEPQEVAQLWGQRRPSEHLLQYDYFARALRYHYKNQTLMSVPGRKLVYKFGLKVFEQKR